MTTKHKIPWLSRQMNRFQDHSKSVSNGQPFDGKPVVLARMETGLKHYEHLWNQRKQVIARRDANNPNRVQASKSKQGK